MSRSVSAEGYISQSGTEVITADLTRRVSPVLAVAADAVYFFTAGVGFTLVDILYIGAIR